ncbi:MAG: polysaccharide pyruvyl transferase family protein [Desulfobacteraceae bacterium]|nr:polysaccharide pyruvyl transferase family protein [Desulfobacteraceae bacterium]
MKKRVCVIGNFSGRNAGDAAILGCLLEDVSAELGECRFTIPTINKKFVRRGYGKFDIEPVGLLPQDFSLKIFGLPIFRAVLSADLVLVTDAILFDYRLLNPLFNYLSTMALVLPLARQRGIPVVLYNVSLGPVHSGLGKACLARVVNASSLVMLRDRQSNAVLEDLPGLRVHGAVHQTADCALNAVPSSPARLAEIARREGILGGDRPWISFNINSYLDVYVRGNRGKGIRQADFTGLVAAALDRFIDREGINVVLVITQPMDSRINEEMLAKVRNRDRIRIVTNREFSYQDLTAVFSAVQMHFGMRTHSLILASSVETPVVALIATPKNRGYMRSIEQDEQMVEFPDLTVESLYRSLEETWTRREAIRAELGPIIRREKGKARGAARLLKKHLAEEWRPNPLSSRRPLATDFRRGG